MIGGNSLVVQLLGLHTSTAGGTGSIPGQGSKILHTSQLGKKTKTKTKTPEKNKKKNQLELTENKVLLLRKKSC